MPLNTTGLNEAYLRKLQGTANATDIANLNYAQSKGWTYQPPAPTAAPTIPAGYQPISGAQYNTRALQQANFSNIQPIGNTLYGIPKVAKSLTSDQLTGGTPSIPTDTLPYQTSPQATIAGANSYMTNLQTDLAAEQARQRELENRLMTSQTTANDLLAQIGGKGQEYRSELEKYNYTANVGQLQEINKQIAAKTAEFQNAIAAQEGRIASASSIYGRQALLQRQQAAEVAGLSAIAQALQGNITLAQNTAKDAINVKYEPMENQLKQQLQQINFIYNDLSRADQKRADAQKLVLEERARELEEQKTTENNISNIALTAAQKGADINTLNSIRNAKTLDDAILVASGATPILTPAGLAGLTENDIMRVGSKIYKKGKNWLTDAVDNTPVKIGSDANGDLFYDPATNTVKTANEISSGANVAQGIVATSTGETYDIKSYATDPTHEAKIQSILNNIGQLKSIADIDNYISSVVPNSPVTGQMIANSASKYGVSWEMMVAIMQQDSSFGTAGKAVRTKNPGNVGNTDSGRTQTFGSWQAGVDAVAKNLAWRKTTATQTAQDSNISSVTGKPLTEPERLSRTYANRLIESDQIISRLEKNFTSMSVGNVLSSASIFGIQLLPEFAKSEDRKKLEQAERNFINAVLRKESGAAISDAEFNNARKQYFPQIGDTDSVIEQKRRNRRLVIEGMMLSGGAYPQSSQQSSQLSDDQAYQEYLKIKNQ